MAKKVTCVELNKALIKAREGQKLGRHLLILVDKIGKGKKLKSHEFLQVHAIIWQAGPTIKYGSPHKWARVLRDGWNHQ